MFRSLFDYPGTIWLSCSLSLWSVCPVLSFVFLSFSSVQGVCPNCPTYSIGYARIQTGYPVWPVPTVLSCFPCPSGSLSVSCHVCPVRNNPSSVFCSAQFCCCFTMFPALDILTKICILSGLFWNCCPVRPSLSSHIQAFHAYLSYSVFSSLIIVAVFVLLRQFYLDCFLAPRGCFGCPVADILPWPLLPAQYLV